MRNFLKVLAVLFTALGTAWLLGRAAEIERKNKRLERTIDVWSKLP